MTMRIPTEEELNAPKCPKCGAILKQIGHPGDFDYMCPNCTKVTVIDDPEITGYSLTERGIEVDGFTEKIKLPKASIGVGILNPRPDPQKVFNALMDPEVDDFIDSTRDMEEEDGEEDYHRDDPCSVERDCVGSEGSGAEHSKQGKSDDEQGSE